MTPLKRLAAGMAVAALVAGGAACTKDDPVAQPTTAPPATSASPSASASPTPTPTLSQRQQAEADAIAMVKEYYAVRSTLEQRPTDSRTRLNAALQPVSVLSALTVSRTITSRYKQNGWHSVGVRRLSEFNIGHLSLVDQPNAKPPKVPVVGISLCVDVSGIDVINKMGASQVSPTRLARSTYTLKIYNYNWPNRSGWRVGDTTSTGKKC